MVARVSLAGLWRKRLPLGRFSSSLSPETRALLLVAVSFPGQVLFGLAFFFRWSWLSCFAPSFLVGGGRFGLSGFFGEDILASCGSGFLGWVVARKASEILLVRGWICRGVLVRLFSGFLGLGPVVIWTEGLFLLLLQFLMGLEAVQGLGPYVCLYDPGLGLWGPFGALALAVWATLTMILLGLFLATRRRIRQRGLCGQSRAPERGKDIASSGPLLAMAPGRMVVRLDAPAFLSGLLPIGLLLGVDGALGFPSAVRNVFVDVCGKTVFSFSGAGGLFALASAVAVVGLTEILAVVRIFSGIRISLPASRQVAASAIATGEWVAVMVLDAATGGNLLALVTNRLVCLVAVTFLNLRLWKNTEA